MVLDLIPLKLHNPPGLILCNNGIYQNGLINACEPLDQLQRIGYFLDRNVIGGHAVLKPAGYQNTDRIVATGGLTDPQRAPCPSDQCRSILSVKKCVEHEIQGS